MREAFTFSARMKLKSSEEEQDVFVEKLLSELGMNHIANNMIGGTFRGITSGERKRCAIGIELVSDPSVIILDEPTSGLDSFKA